MNSKTERVNVKAVDVKLAGDILRVVYAGLPKLIAENPGTSLDELRENHQLFRKFLNDPPNGNLLVNSCLLYPPFSKEAAGTLFLASQFAYSPFAGTALMAAATVLVDEIGIDYPEPNPTILFDTARGVHKIKLHRENGEVTNAVWSTGKPKLLVPNALIPDSNGRSVSATLAFAGLPYLVVSEDELGTSLDDLEKIGPAAAKLSAQANKRYPTQSLGVNDDYANYLVMVYSRVSANHVRTIWVSDLGVTANSAGGTGSLSILATMIEQGEIRSQEAVIIEAPGGSFECRISEDEATVSAEVQTVSKHEFYW